MLFGRKRKADSYIKFSFPHSTLWTERVSDYNQNLKFSFEKKPCKISHFLPRLDKWLHSCFPFKQSSLWTWACWALTSLLKSLSCVYWAAGGLSHTHPARLPLWKPCVWAKDGGRYTKEACVGPYPGWAVLLPDWACAWPGRPTSSLENISMFPGYLVSGHFSSQRLTRSIPLSVAESGK